MSLSYARNSWPMKYLKEPPRSLKASQEIHLSSTLLPKLSSVKRPSRDWKLVTQGPKTFLLDDFVKDLAVTENFREEHSEEESRPEKARRQRLSTKDVVEFRQRLQQAKTSSRL
mmetsp:Transcript_93207/g.165746  ORF Transcript_93207/g.165746 Transcript_93207/m.165746 type:complete len:114 (+) Transcript_93207:464-805(+)